MDLDNIANVAEIVGVILVVVTLVFLTLQIRQNTDALMTTTMQAAMQSEMEFASIIIDNADVWDKVLSSKPLLAGEETRRGIILVNIFMIDTESRYHQFQAGYLDAQSWECRRGTLPEWVGLQIFEQWRYSLGGLSHSADFLQLLDNLKKETLGDQHD